MRVFESPGHFGVEFCLIRYIHRSGQYIRSFDSAKKNEEKKCICKENESNRCVISASIHMYITLLLIWFFFFFKCLENPVYHKTTSKKGYMTVTVVRNWRSNDYKWINVTTCIWEWNMFLFSVFQVRHCLSFVWSLCVVLNKYEFLAQNLLSTVEHVWYSSSTSGQHSGCFQCLSTP